MLISDEPWLIISILIPARERMPTTRVQVPTVGATLWGYEPRQSTWLEHQLRAEALACEADGVGWILMTADVGGFSRPLADCIRADVAERTGLSADSIMLTATHTHSGPHVTDALWCERSALESAYFADLRRLLADNAAAAWHNRAEGQLLHGHAAAPHLASNRRVQDADGKWTNVWSDPKGTHSGYFDPTLDILAVRRPDGGIDALLVNFGCHPVCYGSRSLGISGDYVSYMKDALESRGLVRTAMFTVSGHGNIDPRHCVQDNRDIVQRMGVELADTIEGALNTLAPVLGSGACAFSEPWEIQTTWDVSGRLAIYFPHPGPGETIRTSTACIAAGDCIIIGLPGEAVSEYRRKFAERSPFTTTILVSLTNDFIGYLTTDEILSQGAYEANICPSNPIESALTAQVDIMLSKSAVAIRRQATPPLD